MNLTNTSTYLWAALIILVLGSIYLIVEGYKVHKLFAESIVGKLIKALVVILLIEMYSLGIAVFAFLILNPKTTAALVPIVLLWIVCLVFAIAAVRSAKHEVTKIVK